MKYRLYFISSMIIFGSIGLIVKGIPLSSAEIAMIRGIIGSIFLIITAMILKIRPSFKTIKKNVIYLLISGSALGFNWMLLFEAYRYTSITNATLSYYFAPVIVVLLSPILLKERLTLRKFFCVLVALAGMFLLVWTKGSGGLFGEELKGIGFGLAAATLYALVIIMNKLTKDMEGLETTVIQLTLASLIITVYVIYNGGIGWEVPSSHAIIRLLLVGFLNTGLAYLLYFTSVQRLESQTVAIFSYIDPISAVMMSALFMGEKLSAPQIAGGILILASAFISGRDKKSTHN